MILNSFTFARIRDLAICFDAEIVLFITFVGVCNASVIFGIGKQKYRTEYVRDNDPTWNEETVM